VIFNSYVSLPEGIIPELIINQQKWIAATPAVSGYCASISSSGGSSGMEMSESVTTSVWEPEPGRCSKGVETLKSYGACLHPL